MKNLASALGFAHGDIVFNFRLECDWVSGEFHHCIGAVAVLDNPRTDIVATAALIGIIDKVIHAFQRWPKGGEDPLDGVVVEIFRKPITA